MSYRWRLAASRHLIDNRASAARQSSEELTRARPFAKGSALALASFNTRMPASPIEKPGLVTASTAARVKPWRA